ncbi:hypothetical protein JHK86_009873 [Glycine max]|nr:hypothetical protein JHK86_009873 [Glycine max]
MRMLALRHVRREYGNAICTSVVEMTRLESLDITAIYEDEIIGLNSISSISQLRRLKLKARLEKMPNWISKLDCLIYLMLALSNLKDDPLRWLDKLPHLYSLPCLESFAIIKITHLKKVPSGIKALVNLKVLDFLNMPTEFVESVVLENEQDYWIINHVPLVVIRHWIDPKVNDFKVYTIHLSSKES